MECFVSNNHTDWYETDKTSYTNCFPQTRLFTNIEPPTIHIIWHKFTEVSYEERVLSSSQTWFRTRLHIFKIENPPFVSSSFIAAPINAVLFMRIFHIKNIFEFSVLFNCEFCLKYSKMIYFHLKLHEFKIFL